MPISFICPHCGRHTDVAEKFAGMSGPCAGCGRPVAIPTLAEYQEQNQDQPTARGAIGLAVGGFAALIVCGLAAAFLVPTLIRMQTQAQFGTTETNLKLIAGAMQAYHDRWGSFPPAVTMGPNGRPYHSWRVLLLPYLDRDDLYVRYNMREPWDSPNNRLLAQQIPDVYSNGAPDGSGRTRFVVVVGERTLFPPGTTTSRADAQKGLGGTILVVESAYSPVEWIAPEDLSFDSMNFAINDPQGTCISGDQIDGALVAMADGSTMLLSQQTTTEPAVQMMLLRDSAPFGGTALGVSSLYVAPLDVTRRYEPVDFAAVANQELQADFHGGRQGNNLSNLTTGEQTFGGVNFDVKERMLCLGQKEGTASYLPERIDGISIGKQCERLHFLHGTGWKAPQDGTPIGHYEVHYADGTVEMIPIVYGVDVRDWWDTDGSQAVERGRMVWTGTNRDIQSQNLGATQLRLYLCSWDNPKPETPITSLDFVAYRETECAPFCVAISIDNPRDQPSGPEQPPSPQEEAAPAAASPAAAATPAPVEEAPAESANTTAPVEVKTETAPAEAAPTPPTEEQQDGAAETENELEATESEASSP